MDTIKTTKIDGVEVAQGTGAQAPGASGAQGTDVSTSGASGGVKGAGEGADTEGFTRVEHKRSRGGAGKAPSNNPKKRGRPFGSRLDRSKMKGSVTPTGEGFSSPNCGGVAAGANQESKALIAPARFAPPQPNPPKAGATTTSTDVPVPRLPREQWHAMTKSHRLAWKRAQPDFQNMVPATSMEAKKRNRFDGSTPFPSLRRDTKRPTVVPGAMSFADVVRGPSTKLALVATGFPGVKLTESQVMCIDEAVVSLVLSQDANESVLSFSRRHLEHGALIVSCQGASDSEWLVRNVDRLRLPDGLRLKAISPEDLPSWAIVRIYVQSTSRG